MLYAVIDPCLGIGLKDIVRSSWLLVVNRIVFRHIELLRDLVRVEGNS